MRRTFQYRLFPNRVQRTALQRNLDACRWVYNKTLEVRKHAWDERREHITRYGTNKLLTVWRNEHEFLASGHSQTMQEAQKRVDLAFRAFFRRVKSGEKPGHPRFRGGNRYDSFTYPQNRGNWKVLDDRHVRLSKVGDVKIKLHRPLEGECKTLTIRRDTVGNWYAYFSCVVEPKPLLPTDKVIGIDVGLTHFATLSDGNRIKNPRFFHKNEQALSKAQRRLSKSARGTLERRRRRRVVQHIYQRISNRRRNFAHQESRKLIDRYQLIALEKLNIVGMRDGGNHGLNRSIADAAWNQFVQCCSSKAEDAGRTVVLVDPINTTKACSSCGEIVPKSLSQRVHHCPKCGLILDRDHNAALNILARGLASMGINP